MTGWTAGYVADIGYTFGYYTELNPLRVQLPLLSKGLVAPPIETACELGFGQGLSANIHAAASATGWWGTDFNPSQAAFARELAAASRSGAQLFDEAFAEFCERADLPDFDYIGLHGIWSWISDENRQVIVDFLRRKLKVGGVLYISYNTLPGWAAFAPMRHLMTEHADVLGAEGRGIVSRIDGAMEFADKLLGTNPAFSRANPLVGDRLKKMSEHNRHYLAHEYFNKDWHPMHFATMADWLGAAKLGYAGSAHYLDHIDAVNLSADQQQFMGEIPDAMFRETVRDFMVNQQFRRDYWIKGPRQLTGPERLEALAAHRVILAAHRPDISLKVNGALGEATLTESVYLPILDLMADHQPRSLAAIAAEVADAGVTFAQVVQAALVLCGGGTLASVQDASVDQSVCRRLNAHLCRKSLGSNDISYLASPVTGGGVSVGRFQQLFLLAHSGGAQAPADWAAYAWQQLAAQNQKLLKDGVAIERPEDNLAELTRQAEEFALKRLPVLEALEVC